MYILYGQHINNQDSILSYRYAIKNIDERLSLKPKDVESWKDKAKYHAYAGQSGEAYASLIKASRLAPDDPSIYVDMGIILATNNEYEKACKDFNRASRVIDLSRKGNRRFLKIIKSKATYQTMENYLKLSLDVEENNYLLNFCLKKITLYL